MRWAVIVLFVLAGFGAFFAFQQGESGIEVEVFDLPEGSRELDVGTLSPGIAVIFTLKVTSHHGRKVRLRARLEPPHPEGMIVRLSGGTELLPQASGKVKLHIGGLKGFGPIKTRIILDTVDVPGWQHVFDVVGSSEPKKHTGPVAKFEPPVVDLGPLRPGQAAEFDFIVQNIGTEEVIIERWEQPRAQLALRNAEAGQIIVPQGSLQVSGRVKAPDEPGAFEWRIRIVSNDRYQKVRRITVRGMVVPRYAPRPFRYFNARVVRAAEPEIEIRIVADEGEKPFTVKAARDLGPYFKVGSLGGTEPASAQTVTLRVLQNAPLGERKLTLHFDLEPEGLPAAAWPAHVNIVTNIMAEPSRIFFGPFREGTTPKRLVRLVNLIDRDFKVTNAFATAGKFDVEAKRPAGLSWRLTVSPAPGLPPGRLKDVIKVETDDPDTPSLLIDVDAEIVRRG
ncbi:MAG: hypothetical protein O7E54_10890 [Planctomycetota bacterium]|nr:hypothetical protein [Planctomycetota bacterium]